MERGRNKRRKQGIWEEMCKDLRMLATNMLGREMGWKEPRRKDTIGKK